MVKCRHSSVLIFDWSTRGNKRTCWLSVQKRRESGTLSVSTTYISITRRTKHARDFTAHLPCLAVTDHHQRAGRATLLSLSLRLGIVFNRPFHEMIQRPRPTCASAATGWFRFQLELVDDAQDKEVSNKAPLCNWRIKASSALDSRSRKTNVIQIWKNVIKMGYTTLISRCVGKAQEVSNQTSSGRSIERKKKKISYRQTSCT